MIRYAGYEKSRTRPIGVPMSHHDTTEMHRLWRDGLSMMKIAEALNLSPSTVWKYCKEIKRKKPYPKEYRRKIDDVRVYNMVVKRGMPRAEVARIFDVTKPAIFYSLQRYQRKLDTQATGVVR